MRDSSDHLRLTLYRRRHCPLCDEADDWLQAALEDRVRRGADAPWVRRVEVDDDPQLAERYGGVVPVLAFGDQELPLVTSGRQVRSFLDRLLPEPT